MSYYTGRGDYYSGKGDPGIFSTLGNIVKTVGGVVGTVVPGVGAASSALGGLLTGSGGGSSATPQTGGIALPFSGGPPMIPQQGGNGCSGSCGTGYHLNKSGHYNRSGYVAPKSTCVRNRKTNYANPRALARAAKRMDGFVSVARKAMKSTNYKVVSKSYKQNWRKPLKR